MTTTYPKKPKLVVFDVEGVLIPKNRLFFEVAKELGIIPVLKVLFYGFLYEVGIMPLKRALTNVFKAIEGAKVEVLTQKLMQLRITPDAVTTFVTLRNDGSKTALISSGLPTFLVEKLANIVGADYAVGIEIGVKDEKLTGEFWGDVTEPQGKFKVFKELIEDQHLCPNDCVVVADDRNNASIFLKETKKVGYNPDFLIRIKADAVVTGKLSKILPIINQEEVHKGLPSKRDATRELIHGSGFFIPILAVLFGVAPVALFIVSVTGFYIVSELARIRGKSLPIFSTITRHAASQSELRQFALAPIYFAFGILVTLLIFPAPVSSAAIAIFTIGDSTASIIGGTISKKPLPFNGAKTLEGCLAFFIFSFLAASLFISPWFALIGALVGMIVEYLPLPINDNVLIPIITGLVLRLIV